MLTPDPPLSDKFRPPVYLHHVDDVPLARSHQGVNLHHAGRENQHSISISYIS